MGPRPVRFSLRSVGSRFLNRALAGALSTLEVLVKLVTRALIYGTEDSIIAPVAEFVSLLAFKSTTPTGARTFTRAIGLGSVVLGLSDEYGCEEWE